MPGRTTSIPNDITHKSIEIAFFEGATTKKDNGVISTQCDNNYYNRQI